MLCIRKNICSQRKKTLLFLPCNMAAVKNLYSAIGKHLINIHGGIDTSSLSSQFSFLKKCQTKYDCLLHEKFFNKELKPSLNTQEDSIREKLFT